MSDDQKKATELIAKNVSQGITAFVGVLESECKTSGVPYLSLAKVKDLHDVFLNAYNRAANQQVDPVIHPNDGEAGNSFVKESLDADDDLAK